MRGTALRRVDRVERNRFGAGLRGSAPAAGALKDYAKAVAESHGVRLVNGVSHSLASASTYADVERIIVSEQRRMLLREEE